MTRLPPCLRPGLWVLIWLLPSGGCERYWFLPFAGQNMQVASSGTFGAAGAFSDNLIQGRTFTNGTAVTTVTYRVDDLARTPLGIDFNGDGKIDPVVGYGDDQAVIQILLSRGPAGTVEFTSLTLDSKRDMEDLADVAVGDIDGDGALDIVAAARAAVWYFHHPSGQPTTDLRQWGNPDQNDELRERIDSSYEEIGEAELQALITQAAGPGVNLDDYIVTVEQLYSNVEIGDLDRDGDNDVAASRSFMISLTPRPQSPAPPIQIVDGNVLVFLNPGLARDGHGWTQLSIGVHERQQRLDRDRAAGLVICDVDGDGDLDLVSSARDDNNVQVAWFENPGGELEPADTWTQWRIGSIRDAWSIDVADLTGDGRPDVVATGGEQMQMMLFAQPADGPKRDYDWDSYPLATFESYQPRSVVVLDVDNDAVLELVVGGTAGALRYFEPPADPRQPWTGYVLVNFEPPGDVGLLGYGDLDRDLDADLVAVVSGQEDNDSRIAWVRNDLAP